MTSNFPSRYQGVPIYHCVIKGPPWWPLISHHAIKGFQFIITSSRGPISPIAFRGHLYFRLDIILVKGLSKHTLNTYFSGMKIDPKYAFLHAVFLICVHVLSKICQCDQKQTFFFPSLHVFAPLSDVRAYITWSWKTTLITWIFLRGWYPASNTSAPPARFLVGEPNVVHLRDTRSSVGLKIQICMWAWFLSLTWRTIHFPQNSIYKLEACRLCYWMERTCHRFQEKLILIMLMIMNMVIFVHGFCIWWITICGGSHFVSSLSQNFRTLFS